MKRLLLELLKFVYSMVLAVAFMLVFAFLLDVVAALVSNGWRDYTGHARAGDWPITRGTFQRIWLTPWIFIVCLWLGISGIVRAMLGSRTPTFLRKLAADPPAAE